MATCLLHRFARTAAAIAPLLLAAFAPAQTGSFVNWESPHVHPLDITPDGSRLMAVNTADNRLEIFSIGADGTLTPLHSVPVGLDPVSVRARTNGEAWVANLISDSVSIVDIASGRVTRTITVGDEPADIVFAGTPQRAFVSLSQLNRLLVLDPNNPSATGVSVAIQGEDPRALAVSPDGATVYALIFESGNHTTCVPRAAVTAVTGPYGGQNPPPNSGNQFDPPRTPGQPTPPRVAHIVRKNSAGQWTDDNNRNWTGFISWDVHGHDVAIVNASTLAVTYANDIMTTPAGIAVRSDGRVAIVGSEARNEIRFEPNLNGIFIRSHIGSFAPSSPQTIQIADLNPHLTYASPSTSIVMRDQSIGDPRALVFAPTSGQVYACGIGSNIVVASDLNGVRLGLVTVGDGPSGLVLNPTGSRLFVLNRFGGSISVVNTATMSEVQRRTFFDPTPAAILVGRPFMFDTHATSGLGQASCASCHIDTRTDHLAWDLGNPAGAMIDFQGDNCQEPGACVDWHPLRGPAITQTMQGIIGNEPFHWRGEKTGIEDFNAAYTDLQGADAQLSATEMAALKTYIATIIFPPNPNRNLDGSLRTSLTTSTGTGNPSNGQTLWNTMIVLPNGPGGAQRCVDCHPGSDGTSLNLGIPLGPVQQNRKMPQMRNIHEKTGADDSSLVANRGFGFNMDSEFSTFADLFAVGFQFSQGGAGAAQRRDLEAFMLSFATDTHAGVGAQAYAANGGAGQDETTRISQFLSIAAAQPTQVALVVRGVQGGIQRGYALQGGIFQSDRVAQTVTPNALLAAAAAGNELTYMLVPAGMATRVALDRDGDGAFDRDEIDAGTDPADASSFPGACPADLAPLAGDGIVDGIDLSYLFSQWGVSGDADLNHNGIVDGSDLSILFSAWGPCNP